MNSASRYHGLRETVVIMPETTAWHQKSEKLYRNAPLVEAVCEFRFVAGEPWDLTFFGLLYEKVAPEYTIRERLTQIQNVVGPGPAGSLSAQFMAQETLRISRADRSSFIQVSPHLLSVHHVRPYSGWVSFVHLIEFALAAYRDVAKPATLERIGFRCINHIHFPFPRVEPADYFDFYPFVGPNLSKDYFDVICGIHTAFNEGRDALRIFLRSIPASIDVPVAFVLDLDYFLQMPGTIELDDVPQWLEVAHKHVKGGFEGAIKERLRQMFDGEGRA